MPGASSLPSMMAGGSGFQGGASALAGAYNAMPATARLGGLFESYMTPKNAMQGARGLLNMGGQQEAPPPMMAPAPMQAPPPKPPSMPPPQMNLMSSRRMIRPQRRY
jgi:hypothetical protein